MSPDPESHDYDPRLFYPMPMEKQPEALRLADVLDLLWMDGHTPQKAAAELRRLHSMNAQLLELLEEARDELKVEEEQLEFVSRIFAATAAAKGEA